VHGFIRVSKQERCIIDRPEVQRLRRIHQLGPGYFIYHGAEHSRFGHSLGTLEIATRLFEVIHRKRPEALGENDEQITRNWQLVRLAALVHDVGHPPFSHATEDVMPRDQAERPYRHEDYTCAVLRSPEMAREIDEQFGSMGISAHMVASLMEFPQELGAEGVLLKQLISSELDADRMDYLVRDSMYAGVEYGRFDIDRLLETVAVARWSQSPWLLAVETGGLFALEAFLLARYYMYIQVYLHDVRRFYDITLMHFLKGMLPNGVYPPPEQLSDYLDYDDLYVLQEAKKGAAQGNSWADVLWNRNHWRTVAETGPLPATRDAVAWLRAEQQLESQFGDALVFDDATGQPYQRLQFGPYDLKTVEEEGKSPILVVQEGESSGVPVDRRSPMVQNLGAWKIILMRLYARPDKEDEVKTAWQALFGNVGGAS
jgi:HD superfamily phosphohydrolase